MYRNKKVVGDNLGANAISPTSYYPSHIVMGLRKKK